MNITDALVDIAAPVAAAVAAVGSWWAATRSNHVTRALAAIEQDRRKEERERRHEELTPNFTITCSESDTAPDQAYLRVALKSGKLEYLDEVTITILDEVDREHWARGLPDGMTQEQAEAFVWGPWEFNTGASAQVVSNRTTKARSYSIVTGKNWDLLALNRTRPGHWMSGTSPEKWRKQYADEPLRLLVTCHREGYAPWIIPYEVTSEPHGPSFY
jgi:hypothetical protein